MRHQEPIRPAKVPMAGLAFLAAAVLCLATATAYCQVAPSGTAPSDDQTASDQASLDGATPQTADTPNLNSLNENAASVQLTDGALTRRPFFSASRHRGHSLRIFSIGSTTSRFKAGLTSMWQPRLVSTCRHQPPTSGRTFGKIRPFTPAIPTSTIPLTVIATS